MDSMREYMDPGDADLDMTFSSTEVWQTRSSADQSQLNHDKQDDAHQKPAEDKTTVSVEDKNWQAKGSCLGVDPELFFPLRGELPDKAKEVCGGCVVRLACLEDALSRSEQVGVRGGLSAHERRKIYKQRRAAIKAA